MHFRRALLVAGICSVISACTALPSADSPLEYLDQETAATVSVVGRPIVFAHERPNRAAHMRDYVTLAAATVNRSGKTDYVVIAYFWTTFDPHGQQNDDRVIPAGTGELVIVADDRRIQLQLEGHSAHDAGIGAPIHAPPGSAATPNVYRTDLATLRFIAAAHHLAVLANADDPVSSYEIWDDRRAALDALVRWLNGER